MLKLISYLHSAETVACFQRFCGIRLHDDDKAKKSETAYAGIDKSSLSTGQFDLNSGDKNAAAKMAERDVLKRRNTRLISGGEPDGSCNGNTVHSNHNEKNNSITTTDTLEIQASQQQSDHKMNYTITNYFLYYLFCFASNLGNEAFYISFFPFWFWNVDGFVGRRLCFFWGLFMYLGQAAKDVFRIPRPASPPVVKMEDRYSLEFGMPSTHAMVGAGIPFGIYILTKERYIFPSEVTLVGAIIWCATVCLSRVYLGMHSVLDVLAGLAYVFFLMFVCFYWSLLDVVDNFVLHGGVLSFLFCLLIPLALCVFYPAADDKWSTARGDTTVILAVCSGQMLSHWLSYHLGLMTLHSISLTGQASELGGVGNLTSEIFNSTGVVSSVVSGSIISHPPYPVTPLTFEWIVLTGSRTFLGLIIVVLARFVIKFVVLRVICRLLGTKISDQEARKSLQVELPYKFATYSLLTILGLFVCPVIFSKLGVERETYFTEV